ncbi:hypothetical protein SRHO_G00049470 [Serrasalmus rhombeus]
MKLSLLEKRRISEATTRGADSISRCHSGVMEGDEKCPPETQQAAAVTMANPLLSAALEEAAEEASSPRDCWRSSSELCEGGGGERMHVRQRPGCCGPPAVCPSLRRNNDLSESQDPHPALIHRGYPP